MELKRGGLQEFRVARGKKEFSGPPAKGNRPKIFIIYRKRMTISCGVTWV